MLAIVNKKDLKEGNLPEFMVFGLEKHHFLINPVTERSFVYANRDNTEIMQTALDKLPVVLGDPSTWVLSGSFAISTTKGNFYRLHRDIDVALEFSNLGKVVSKAKESGYDLFSRVFMAKISPKKKLDVYRNLEIEEVLDDKFRHIRLVKTDSARKPIVHSNLLSYIDLYLHLTHDGSVFSLEDSLEIPRYFMKGVSYETISGRKINVVNLDYIEHLKSSRTDGVSVLDMEVINSLK